MSPDEGGSSRELLLFAWAALAGPLVVLGILGRPELVLLAAAVAIGALLAAWSPAVPLGLAGMAAWVESFVGTPLPANSVILTVVAWTAAGVVVALARSPLRREALALALAPVLLTALLGALMLVRLAAAPDPLYGQEKLSLLIVNMAFLLGGIVVAARPRDVDVLLVLTVVVASVAAITLFLQVARGLQPVHPGRYSLAGTDVPIELGRQAAAGIIIAVYALVMRPDRLVRVAAVVALPVLGSALAFSGSRGPTLGLLAGLVVLLAALPIAGRRARTIGVTAAGLALALLVVAWVVPGQALDRIGAIVTGDGGEGSSTTGRTTLWADAWDVFTAHPLAGVGTGGFGAFSTEPYPHNILLEVGAELGVAGVVILGALLAWAVVALVRGRGTDGPPAVRPLVGALLGAAIVNAMFSGDVADNAALWIVIGLAAGLWARARVGAATAASGAR